MKTVRYAVSQGVRFVGWQEKIVLLLSTSPRVADSAGTKLAKNIVLMIGRYYRVGRGQTLPSDLWKAPD